MKHKKIRYHGKGMAKDWKREKEHKRRKELESEEGEERCN